MIRGRRTAVGAFLVAVCVGLPASAAATGRDSDQVQKVLTIRDPRITESSGLAASTTLPGVLWTVNDSGDGPRVFGVDGEGRTVATVTLAGATARDWEAIAVGPRPAGGTWLWVGDIGDNLSTWPTVRLYRVAEPRVPGDQQVAWTAYDLRFPDGPRDAEALLVDPGDGRVYVVSKRVGGGAVYRAPRRLRTDRVNELTRVARAPSVVTDGAFSADGRVALRGYLSASIGSAFDQLDETVPLPLQRQGESLTWTLDGSAILVGSEGGRSAVWRVPVPEEAVAAGADVSEPAAPQATPSARPSGEPSSAATTSSSGQSPWLVALLGIALGGGLGLVVSRRRRSRS